MKKHCRFCAAELNTTVVDLGVSPLANRILAPDQLDQMEPHYPLRAYICNECKLVQLEAVETPQNIFGDYSYFSSYAATWLEHCQRYAKTIIQDRRLGPSSLVVEIASNDGYLLQYFAKAGIPVLGIEPAANVARAALETGIPTEVAFFGVETAKRLAKAGHAADLMVANNVLAHVPDINDFVAGIPYVLKPDGVITIEFPHLANLIRQRQFDTIYHEHFSYLSGAVVSRIFVRHGLKVFDIERIPTHGGSLRVYAGHRDNPKLVETARLRMLLEEERKEGLEDLTTYERFSREIFALKFSLLRTLVEEKQAGKSIVGYGAPAKGNTLLNYCGIGPEFLDYTVDINPHKQGHYLPGTHIAIFSPERIRETRPDLIFILAWNLKDEISLSLSYAREWGARFLTAVPSIEIF